MKFLHLSDLHLGKRLNGFSMIDDQKYILDKITGIALGENCGAVLISGDVYDKSVPTVEAVSLFDSFILKLSQNGILVFIISGNHDSAERIAFGSGLMQKSGVYISPVYDGTLSPVTLKDKGETYRIYMLPFIKPADVKRFFPDLSINSYTDAVSAALSACTLCNDSINILLAHQFVTGALRSDSEEISVGGADNVDFSVFSGFDYVALGHIHRPQKAGGEYIRYCGSPLKYSFSEAGHQKSVPIIEFKSKKELTLSFAPLVPLHDMRKIQGSYMYLTSKSTYENTDTEDYIYAVLTDEEDVLDAVGKLRTIYPNLMKLDYDNKRTKSLGLTDFEGLSENKSPMSVFKEFYEKQNGALMSPEQEKICQGLIKEIWGDENETA